MKPQQADFAKRLNCQHFTSVISPFVDYSRCSRSRGIQGRVRCSIRQSAGRCAILQLAWCWRRQSSVPASLWPFP